MAPLKPGWYSDPHGSRMLRRWDGSEWTGQLHEPVPPEGELASDASPVTGRGGEQDAPKYGYFPKDVSESPAEPATPVVEDRPAQSRPSTGQYGYFPKEDPDSPGPSGSGSTPGGSTTYGENEFVRAWNSYREGLKNHVWLRWASGIAVLVVVIGIAGSGSSEDSGAGSGTADAGKDSVALSIVSPADNNTVDDDTAVLKGTATAGARVSVVDGRSVLVGASGNWSIPADLESEENVIEVNASKSGMESSSDAITVLHPLSAAELRKLEAKKKAAKRKLVAKRKAEKKRAAAAKRRAAARIRAKRAKARRSFINSAASIPYKQLNKNPDKYAGKKVTYRGQILQIQESGDIGGFMLLSVTDEGYGIWDDNVWVNFDHSISAGEEDIITIYGRVVGSRDYETQIGGSTYVPEIDARYIVTK